MRRNLQLLCRNCARLQGYFCVACVPSLSQSRPSQATTQCVGDRDEAVVERKTSEAWVDIASTTDADGAFAQRLKDRRGRYRPVASEVTSPERTCLGPSSATTRHRHH